jgi:hypothetical protein
MVSFFSNEHLSYTGIKNRIINLSPSIFMHKVAQFLTTIFGSIYHDHLHQINAREFFHDLTSSFYLPLSCTWDRTVALTGDHSPAPLLNPTNKGNPGDPGGLPDPSRG